MRSEPAIEGQIAKAFEGVTGGSRWPGMSYEEGVREALDWVLENTEDAPMDQDE